MSTPSRPEFDASKKADELFFDWFTRPTTQELLIDHLSVLLADDDEAKGDDKAPATPPLAPPSPTMPSPPQSPTSPRDSPPPGIASSPRSPRSVVGDVSPRFTRKKSVEARKMNARRARRSAAAATEASRGKAINLPRFYYRNGRPKDDEEKAAEIEREIERVFRRFGGRISREDFPSVVKACGLPLYWKAPLFVASGGGDRQPVTSEMFDKTWKRLTTTCHDDASQFVWILTKGRQSYVVPEDFEFLIQDIIDTHPGLTILADTPEFQARYVETVIARIFFSVNRSWSGRIGTVELKRSTFLTVLSLLETEPDINQVMEYFSYEHFYVIYCKFWELDTDHDLLIDKTDLARYNDHALPPILIQRLFSEAVQRDLKKNDGKMSYKDFVWFLLADEDKQHPTSIEYWFRLMDLDGDGVLSMYEMEHFYKQQVKRMERRGIETLSVEDCLCQILDMVQPRVSNQIRLRDIKRTQVATVFFNTFVNLEKYLEYEQRDPFATKENEGDSELNAWERFCQRSYDRLIAEEQMAEEYLEDGFDDGLDEELAALKSNDEDSPDLEALLPDEFDDTS